MGAKAGITVLNTVALPAKQHGTNAMAIENYYTVDEVAGLLKVSRDTAAKLVSNLPGTIDVGLKERKNVRRSYHVYRTPESSLKKLFDRRRVRAAA